MALNVTGKRIDSQNLNLKEQVVSINRAGGSPLILSIPDHHGVAAVMSQFHGF